MPDSQQNKDFAELKKSIDTLILIELCKARASYSQIRGVMGRADNNLISKINAAVSGKPKNENKVSR